VSKATPNYGPKTFNLNIQQYKWLNLKTRQI